ncbi:hypothetical protein L6164_018452 [Bauhinia variegata]|uniref:Uncharacterized protein n=1 Tax=Bauhinia variegata TaxID=167791 RepID=A0ACB9NB26_BAUVA|nr:hypothetical protein L6164_018452 [Bauhinia variegata]
MEDNDVFYAEEGPRLNSFLFCSEPFSSAIKSLRLEYSSDCNSTENCNPFDRIKGYLPSIIYFYEFYCSVPKKSMRVMLGFYDHIYDNYQQPFGFNPSEMLIGEGRWDEQKKQLSVVACNFMGMAEPFGSAHVGDCSVRLSLRIPSTGTSKIVGQSNKAVNDPGYFKKITLRDDENLVGQIPSLEYEYNQLDRVRKLCPRNNPLMNQGRRYPDAYSYEMLKFEMNIRDSKGLVGYGKSSPLSVEDHFYGQDLLAAFPSYPGLSFSVPYATSNGGIFHVSSLITITQLRNVKSGGENCLFTMSSESDPTEEVVIAAEGIYDAGAGTLCMVGCGKIYSKNKIPKVDSMDCEILGKFQLPPLKAENGVYVEGSIESMRRISDPLYFKRLKISSAHNWKETERLLRRGLLDCFVEISKSFGREVVCRKPGTY